MLFPQEAAAEEAVLVNGELVPVACGETVVGSEDIEEDVTCEMILNMLDKWERFRFHAWST